MHTISIPTFSVLAPVYACTQTQSVMGALLVPGGYREVPSELRLAGYRSSGDKPQQGYHQSFITSTPNPYAIASYTYRGRSYRVNDPDFGACGQYADIGQRQHATYAYNCAVRDGYTLVEEIGVFWNTGWTPAGIKLYFAQARWTGTWFRNISYDGRGHVQSEEASASFSFNLDEVPSVSTDWQDSPARIPFGELWSAAHIRLPDPSGWRFQRRPAAVLTDQTSVFDEVDISRALRFVEFNDHMLIRSRVGGYTTRAPRGQYLYEWLVQHAYMGALNAIPKACDNSIQNLQAAFDLLLALKSGNVAEIPDILWDDWVNMTRSGSAAAKGLSGKWLQGRYVVATTKSDIDEYVKFGLYLVDRYQQQITASRAHGIARYTVPDGRVYTCRCALNWAEKGLTGMSAFCKGLWQSGLEPNAYVLWDFVPFSFVADWFVPVGDVLEVYSEANYRNSQYFDISDVVFSLAYDTEVKGITAHHYTRWLSAPLLEVDNSYWWDKGDAHASLTTTIKRCVDGGALMTGMKLR